MCLQVKTSNGASVPKPLADDDLRKIDSFREKALRKVRSHVKLVVETMKAEEMKKIFRQTAIGEWKGETIQSMNESPSWHSDPGVLF